MAKKTAKPAAKKTTNLALVSQSTGHSYMKMLPLSELKWEHDRDIGKNVSVEDEEGFPALLQSVKAHGVETPIIVREDLDPETGEILGFRVVAGRRRCEAMKLSERTPAVVPAIVRPADFKGSDAAAAIRENTLRRRLSPVEKIVAVKTLTSEGLGVSDVAREIGLSEQSAGNLMRCGRLCKEALEYKGATLEKLIAAAAWEKPEDQLASLKGQKGKKRGENADGAKADAEGPDTGSAESDMATIRATTDSLITDLRDMGHLPLAASFALLAGGINSKGTLGDLNKVLRETKAALGGGRAETMPAPSGVEEPGEWSEVEDEGDKELDRQDLAEAAASWDAAAEN
jgi:ParB/RepB/Spo0J family partition protein